MHSCESSQNSAVSSKPEVAATDAAAPTKDDESTSNSEKTPSQLVIKEADVRFQVKDMVASTQRIEAAVKQANALVSNTSQNSQEDELSTDFVIRVQPNQFQPLLDQLQKESVKLDFKNLGSDNVAMEYVDVQARIKAKRS
ncbi:hypothetical protein TH61_13230 [Rufibacter sp. DG15C]|nr:hypothetical protein TH61_13230 [Rufibacter sp. DG15C]